MEATHIYAKTKDPATVNCGKTPPSNSDTINKITPPNNCDIPVIHNGELLCADRRLIIFETTVQRDAQSIRMSPKENATLLDDIFIAIIPQKPIIAPIILNILNFSSLKNRNEKQI